MLRHSALHLIATVLFLPGASFAQHDTHTIAAKPPSAGYAPDRIIIKLTSLPADLNSAFNGSGRARTLGVSTLDRIGARHGARGVRPLFRRAAPPGMIDDVGLSRILIIEVPPGTDIPALCSTYAQDNNVEYAEPDYIAQGGSTTPDDLSFSQQWGMNNTGQSGGTVDADIDAPEAWDWQTGSANIVVAVVDSGSDFDHPDLSGKIWTNSGEIPSNGTDDDGNGYIDDYYGWDFVNGDNWPQDDHGHGTHCAGIAAASTDNATGVAGVAWGCPVMTVKVLNSGNSGAWSWIENGIKYAVDNGARAINLSIGGYTPSSSLEDTVNYVYNNGGILCVCTHNDGGSIRYPARYDNVIAVGATDHDDDRASFSNYGSQIDVVGPGVSVYNTLYNDTYASWNGTSMATPHVTGTVALLLSIRSDLTFERVKEVLETTAEDQVGNPVEDTAGWDQYMGWGRINAYQALMLLDEDADSMPDAWEVLYGIDPYSDDSGADSDSDGLTNLEEHQNGTYPLDDDSDDDGLDDGPEVDTHGTDPLSADTDGDALGDGDEVNTYGTEPNDGDSDGDGLFDGEESAYWGANWNTNYDGDGITNNLHDPDSDNDGFSDALEVAAGTDPASVDATLPIWRVSFQPAASARPSQYAPSSDAAYSADLGYGWQ